MATKHETLYQQNKTTRERKKRKPLLDLTCPSSTFELLNLLYEKRKNYQTRSILIGCVTDSSETETFHPAEKLLKQLSPLLDWALVSLSPFCSSK